MAEPRFRAAVVRALLVAAESRPDGSSIVEGLDDEMLTRIANAGPAAWLPAEHIATLYARVEAVAGAEALFEVGAAHPANVTDLPLVSPLIARALALFGRRPGSLIPIFPRVIGLLCRACGTTVARVQAEERSANLHWVDLPHIFRTETWLLGQAGALTGSLRMMGAEAGTADADGTDLESGRASFRMRW